MSAKTMFYAFAVVALAAVWSAAALPLVVDDVTSPAIVKTNSDIETSPGKVVQEQEAEQQQTKGTDAEDASVLQTEVTESSPDVQQSSQTEEVTVGSSVPVVGTDPALPEVSNAKAESDVSTVATEDERTDSVAGTNSPSPVSETNSPIPHPSSSDAKPKPSIPVHDQTPKPYYTGAVQTVKLGPNMPFFFEFFQPFQSFQPFQPFQPIGSNQDQQPFRHPPIPFGTPINPFVSPINAQPFNKMVEAYTNDFRTPGVIILKPKRNVRVNTTTMPPIPLLMNIMLNAFRHQEPSGMMESFDKLGLPPLESVGTTQEGSNKPVRKTTSKTEIIDGHRVQINETTVSGGDENHKSFYHFKEIQVLPEGINKEISNEKLISISEDDTETQKVETNEIKPYVTMKNNDNRTNFVKKTPAEPVPLDEQFQTAAASYFAPYAPLYRSHQQPAGHLQQKQYHGSYLTPNQGFYPAPNQGHYPAPNQGHYPVPNQGHYPVPVQGYYPAPNQGYYPAPNQGYYPPPNQVPQHPAQNHGSRPHQKPINLEGDILVNELVAAQQQASGGTVLPPDVEFVDVNGKPQPSGEYHHYYSNQQHQQHQQHHGNNNNNINDSGNRGHDKFPGRKY